MWELIPLKRRFELARNSYVSSVVQDTEPTASLHFDNLPQAQGLVLIYSLVDGNNTLFFLVQFVSGLFKAFTVGHSGIRTDAQRTESLHS